MWRKRFFARHGCTKPVVTVSALCSRGGLARVRTAPVAPAGRLRCLRTLGQLHCHFGRYAALPVYQFRKLLRVTPRAWAASVMVKPKGSMHWRNTMPPGCGGFFMVMDWFLSVVIDIINILRAVVKTENHPPVGAVIDQKPFIWPLSGCNRTPAGSSEQG